MGGDALTCDICGEGVAHKCPDGIMRCITCSIRLMFGDHDDDFDYHDAWARDEFSDEFLKYLREFKFTKEGWLP